MVDVLGKNLMKDLCCAAVALRGTQTDQPVHLHGIIYLSQRFYGIRTHGHQDQFPTDANQT